jgi:NAD(P)H-dependent flavin oxidoreductase YrpB (nitropropane dioxygenase family)
MPMTAAPTPMTAAQLKARLRIPLIGAPQFIVSGPELVIAQCKAGIVGSFPALNARPKAMLDEWLHRIREELAAHDRAHPERPSAPFAVNQIVHKSNDRLEHDVEVCLKHKVPLAITSLGAREDVYKAFAAVGTLVLHDIINVAFARKAIEKGAGGLVAVAAGAGGHAGLLSPTSIKDLWRCRARSRRGGLFSRLKPWALILAMRVPCLSLQPRLMQLMPIRTISLRVRLTASSTRTCSPAFTATI